nr:hypothetical protein [Sinorhizobium meliloti]
MTELSGLGCPYPAEKRVAVDPAPARHLRYRVAGKLRFFNNSPFVFQRPVSSTALRRFAHSRHQIVGAEKPLNALQLGDSHLF